jgi:hypothetical protein
VEKTLDGIVIVVDVWCCDVITMLLVLVELIGIRSK